MSIDYTQHDHLDHIVTITINRPEARNSLDMAHFRDLAHAWAAFRDDANAWVAVITGVGHDFCTGADLKKFIPELTGDLPGPKGGTRTTLSTPSCIASRCTSRSSPR
ncbi:enoyl-CoA hydratase/isomerase family protein [Mycobacterium kansasii]|uniref:Enoyl-CoA hydratase/isomerase family protein n=1 Tax=Mycobacterium kansasii TaxID=1768 RepID=A0A1V3X2Q5_MYCKA|nr:enoyl-CoA hydratase/isomerase family protein [Mycobacterium kansasii]